MGFEQRPHSRHSGDVWSLPIRGSGRRSDVALQFEAKPLGMAFADADVQSTAFVDTGVHNGTDSSTLIETEATGLSQDTPYHWRARIVTPSPYFPSSPWYSPSANGAQETDVRLLPEPGVLLGLACGAALLARLRRRRAS